jgi:dihydrofolate reductase
MFSNTLESAGWNIEIVDGDHLAETVAELRARPGTKHLLYASADLAATFMRLDLIDEYWLFVNPVTLGGGTSLFGQLDAPVELSLVEARTFDGAMVLLRYARKSRLLKEQFGCLTTYSSATSTPASTPGSS